MVELSFDFWIEPFKLCLKDLKQDICVRVVYFTRIGITDFSKICVSYFG